jgi:hypothetical protein
VKNFGFVLDDYPIRWLEKGMIFDVNKQQNGRFYKKGIHLQPQIIFE